MPLKVRCVAPFAIRRLAEAGARIKQELDAARLRMHRRHIQWRWAEPRTIDTCARLDEKVGALRRAAHACDGEWRTAGLTDAWRRRRKGDGDGECESARESGDENGAASRRNASSDILRRCCISDSQKVTKEGQGSGLSHEAASKVLPMRRWAHTFVCRLRLCFAAASRQALVVLPEPPRAAPYSLTCFDDRWKHLARAGAAQRPHHPTSSQQEVASNDLSRSG